MRLTNLIKKLSTFEPDGFPFLSIYMDASPNDVGRDGYAVWLKTQLAEQREHYQENEFELKRFDEAIEHINEYLDNDVDAAANGIAIFVSLNDEAPFFEAVQLDVPFAESEFYSYDRPHFFPLVRTVRQNPKYAVLWADTNKADIYIFGGENRIRTDNQADDHVENIQNRTTNRTQVGGWSQNRYQRHIENFHLQHAKEAVAELEEIMRKKDVKYLILAGDETTIMPILRPQLSKPVEEKVVGILNISQYDSEDDIRDKTLEAMAVELTTMQMKQVERTFDAARAAAGMGTLGLEQTLRALANGQVQELLISSDINAVEYDPNEVERIFAEYAPGDDWLQGGTKPMARVSGEVADELLRRAIETDAEIFFINDVSLLEEAGGVGAVLRYNMNNSAAG